MALWQRGQVKLVWSEGHELHGLEVVMRRVPLGDTIEGWLSEPEVRPDWDDLTPKQRAERTQENAEQIGRLIVGWNYADEHGDAVPATPEALLACCDADLNSMQDEWKSLIYIDLAGEMLYSIYLLLPYIIRYT